MDKSLKHNNVEAQESNSTEPEQLRRDFLKKFGKYAATTPAVAFTLMSTYSSKAVASATEGAP